MTKDKHSGSSDNEELEIKAKDATVVRKIVRITLISFLLIFLIGILSGYFYVKSALEPVDEDNKEEVNVEIPMGSTTSDISDILEEKGLIENGKIFKFYLKFKNYSDFQAGEYQLSPSFTIEEIVKELQSGKVIEEPVARITIPEGKALEQIASIVEAKLDIPEKEFMKKVEDEKYLKSIVDDYPDLLSDDIFEKEIEEPLEGYLFAGTYDVFEEDPDAESIIDLMLEETNNIVAEEKEKIEDTDLSVHELLTLASIVERESKFSEDRPKVAQVFLNRLEEDMKLQSDITAAYAEGEHKIVMTYEDIEIDSPYNTYEQKGLPPGPIASPSKEAIDAVLEPEGEDFTALYFYARPNGETYYADTLDEHKQYVEQYRQEWYDLEEESKKEKKKSKKQDEKSKEKENNSDQSKD